MEQEKCKMCKGEGGFEFTLPNGKLQKTLCRCDGSGLEIDNLRAKLRTSDIQINQVHKELKNVHKWVKENSTCKTCGGDQNQTWGNIPCQECGLIGNMPWPG